MERGVCSPGGRVSVSQGFETDHPETQWLATAANCSLSLAILVGLALDSSQTVAGTVTSQRLPYFCLMPGLGR